MPGPVKGVVPAQATQQAGKPGRQAGDNKSDTLHKGYQPAGHRRLSGVIEGQHGAQRKRAAQTDAAGESPERGKCCGSQMKPQKPISWSARAHSRSWRRSSWRASAGSSRAPAVCPTVSNASSEPLYWALSPSCI